MSRTVSGPNQTASLIYLQRDAISFGSSLLMFGVLAVVAAKPVIEQVVRLKDQAVVVEFLNPVKEIEPEPVATPSPPPVVSTTKPAVQTPRTIPQASSSSPAPAPTLTPTPTPMPSPVKATAAAEEPATKLLTPAVTATEPTQQAKPAQPVTPAPVPADVAQTTTPAAAPPPVSTKGQSDRYEAQVLRYLESVKRYPSSREARQTRPSGVVTVWFELSRSGKVIDAGIEKSSNSSLLDAEAIKTVRNGSFPAFPDAVFANADKHRFSANLSYELKTSE